MEVCSAKVPVALPSGLRFMETPSVPESEDVYVKQPFATPPASFRHTVSLPLAKLRAPVEHATAFGRPGGIAEAPPNTTIALPAGSDVLAANVCRTPVESESVHPPIDADAPPTFTISINSLAVSLPGSFAQISLRMT
jgi:hypothetical protein